MVMSVATRILSQLSPRPTAFSYISPLYQRFGIMIVKFHTCSDSVNYGTFGVSATGAGSGAMGAGGLGSGAGGGKVVVTVTVSVFSCFVAGGKDSPFMVAIMAPNAPINAPPLIQLNTVLI